MKSALTSLFFMLSLLLTSPLSARTYSDTLIVSLEHIEPYAYTTSSGDLCGVYIDIVDTIFQDAPMPYRIQLLDSITPAIADTLMCSILSHNLWGQSQLENGYSHLLFHTHSAIVSNTDYRYSRVSDLLNHCIAVPDKSFFVEELMCYDLHVDQSLVYSYTHLADAIAMLEHSQCDLIIADFLLIDWYLETHKLKNYQVDELMTLPALYKLYLQPCYTAYSTARPWLDQRLSSLSRTGAFDKIFYTWFGHPRSHKIQQVQSRLWIVLSLLFMMTILLIIGIVLLSKKAKIQLRSFHEFTDILMGLPHGVDMYVDGSGTPVFRNKRSIALEAAQKGPTPVYLQEEQIRFRYKRSRIKIVMKMDVTEIEQAREKANSSSRLKTQFLANTSHDLRSPLNAIVGFADLIGSCDDDESIAEYAQIIELNTHSLLHLIDEIIHLSQLQTEGLSQRKREEYDLYPALQTVIKEHQMYVEREGKSDVTVTLTTNFSSLVVLAHASRVHRVLNNIMSNACKYTHSGSVHMDARYEPTSETIHLQIIDTGVGMSQKTLSYLFTSADVRDHTRKDSYGLGLAICKAILEKANGTIHISSKLNVGTTVSIEYKPVICRYELID